MTRILYLVSLVWFIAVFFEYQDNNSLMAMLAYIAGLVCFIGAMILERLRLINQKIDFLAKRGENIADDVRDLRK